MNFISHKLKKTDIFLNILKKIILSFILFLLLISCKSIDPTYKWYSAKEVIANSEKLRPGDILVLSKRASIRSMWGHVAVLNEEKKIVEFPSYSTGYSESPLFVWQTLNRKVAVFRLKGIDDDYKTALFEEINKTVNKTYGLTFDKNFDKRLYCSQFVYLVFKRAGKKVGKNIDLDSNGGGWVMPFDIMRSPLLENVILN
ncbi:YiiX/YebB-like N1pC/P60 family cysteine hydrolase [Leptotrichia sp. OH3620_COT-345]|uniref:YiiX/YebB-like N1pC/P60 family cysteine hydrolase n=1 Tax=Leptotrichia sp. OH3620_COT-345 TaxID=2491048 RepID=UPI0018F65850|nr:YiiX/YebB-like N1pC/P60 family cysteine hydrolase [Leptotrichia sp. OH3620_COT-345]